MESYHLKTQRFGLIANTLAYMLKKVQISTMTANQRARLFGMKKQVKLKYAYIERVKVLLAYLDSLKQSNTSKTL